jgi:hypothetical protein
MIKCYDYKKYFCQCFCVAPHRAKLRNQIRSDPNRVSRDTEQHKNHCSCK